MPFRCMKIYYRELIGNTIGKVVDVEVDSDDRVGSVFESEG